MWTVARTGGRLPSQRAGWLEPRWRAAILIGALVGAGLLASSEGMHRRIIQMIALAEPMIEQHPAWGALLFVLWAALSAILMFVSSLLLVPIGVKAWGAVGCFFLLWIGWFLGGVATYSLGRQLGRPVVRRLLSAEAIARYESRIPRGGSFLTALLVQLSVPSDIAGYFFGLFKFPVRVYLIALAIGELPYALGTVFLGDAFVQRRFVVLLASAGIAGVALAWVRGVGRHGPHGDNATGV